MRFAAAWPLGELRAVTGRRPDKGYRRQTCGGERWAGVSDRATASEFRELRCGPGSVQRVGGRLDEDVQQSWSGCGQAVNRVNKFGTCSYPSGVKTEARCKLLEVQAVQTGRMRVIWFDQEQLVVTNGIQCPATRSTQCAVAIDYRCHKARPTDSTSAGRISRSPIITLKFH
jgi:hypothetical protein